MSEIRRQYWDSGVFCSLLNKEEGRYQVVRDLLKEAYAGRIEIITSTFALVEVLKLSGAMPITQAQEDELQAFFEYPFIKLVMADRDVCERSRYYVWRHGMKPKDALHMATAERASKKALIHELFSWDGDFIKLDGKTPIGFPISKPFMKQLLIQFPDNEQIEDSAEVEGSEEENPAV
jgi:predicted nucleic acid-binding protein